MKAKKGILLIILVLTVLLTATACSAQIVYSKPYVTEISVTDLYSIDGYVAGDNLNISGAKLIVTYSDMKKETIELTEDMLFDYDMSVPEENKKITVKYGGKTTYFTVNVSSLKFSSVTISSLPNKDTYVVGEKIATEGATLSVVYEGGKTVKVKVTEKMLEAYDNQRVGEQDIFISYYGFKLSFAVTFEDKIVTSLAVSHNPNQNAVFVGMGDKLDLSGMQIKLYYDNGLAPYYPIEEIKDDIRISIDDSEVGTVAAYVAYLPQSYPSEISYPYTGSTFVRVGDSVYPDMELASNKLTANVLSKTYGRVTSVSAQEITVETLTEYEVTRADVKIGQIVTNGQILGTIGDKNVYATAGGGVITEIGDGLVKVQTAPATTFNINVKNRSFQSMKIDTYPVTTQFKKDVNEIIQGDTLDLSTGRVIVEFDNGEWEYVSMDDTLIRVTNSDDDLLRNEIKDFSFTSIDNVKDLPAGRYELRYGMSHGYGDRVKAVVTVVDENGKNIYVQDNRYVSLETGLNYTVSITATYNDGIRSYVTECVYYLATVGAGVRHSRLDITAAGRHKLIITYGGVATDFTEMYVTVIQRYATELNILDVTNNISGRTFRKGDTISIATLQYTVTYNNGDVSEPTGVTPEMILDGSTLKCEEVTARKEVKFYLPDDPEVTPVTLACKVVAMPIVSIRFEEEPLDTVLMAAGSDENQVNLAGGVLRVYYENGSVATVGKTGATLNQLLENTTGRGAKIEITYKEEDTRFLSFEEINRGEHYEADFTYFDEDGASGTLSLKYYIVSEEDAVRSIKISLSPEYYKRTYVQCEDWELTGITFTVTKNSLETTKPMPVTKEMIYDSTTDVVGRDIPVKFRYLGKVDDTTYKINVEPRAEVGLSVTKTGTDLYYNTDLKPDFSEYKFSLSYNAGASAEVSGLRNFDGAKDREGWWYEVYDEEGYLVPFRRAGIKTIRLYHTVENVVDGIYAYSYVYVDFKVEVRENLTDILRVAYEDTSIGSWNYLGEELAILEKTAAGWELFLNELDRTTGLVEDKYLTVYYVDGTKGYVQITSDMVNYSRADMTKGFRKVEIAYKTAKANAAVQVLDAVFDSIEVEQMPCLNFISGSEHTREGGVIRCIFKVKEGDGAIVDLNKYLSMDDKDVTCTGFNSVINPLVDSVTQDVTVQYRDKTTKYMVTIYNKQSIQFKYQNTIFFYGNTKATTATPLQFIPEFTLPVSSDIKLWYVSSEYFVEEGDLFDYLREHTDETEGEMMRILCADSVYRYVNRKYLMGGKTAVGKDIYPVEPLKSGYTRYVLMEVLGNDYYRMENYCLQKYTVIPKVIEVSVVSFTESAYTLDYNDSSADKVNIPTAVMYLYQNLGTIVNQVSDGRIISSVELLSPNVEFFRIGVFVTDAFDKNNPEHIAIVDKIFGAIRDSINTYLSSLHLSATIRANTADKREGINIGQYNGTNPEYLSYRIVAGETLTLNGILELLQGSAELSGYTYGTGIYNVSVGSLCHAEGHYAIDFITAQYKVLPRKITGYVSFDNGWESETNTYTVSLTEANDYNIRLFVSHEDKTNRPVEEAELGYYTDESCQEEYRLEEKPTTAGTYYVKVGDNCFEMNNGSGEYKATDVIITLVIQ